MDYKIDIKEDIYDYSIEKKSKKRSNKIKRLKCILYLK